MKRNIVTFYIGMAVCFLVVIGLANTANIFGKKSEKLIHTEKSQHKSTAVEGSFYDKDGDVIFSPEKPYIEDTTQMLPAYSYLLGYNDPAYSSSGLRALHQEHLYEDKGTGKGGSIYLTIDDVLQKKAYSFLQTRNLSGSVVVLNARNAEILAMVGRREKDYIASNLTSQRMAEYNAIPGFFVAPATGDYQAPGSVFKILTSTAAFIHGKEGFKYNDNGKLLIDGGEITNSNNAAYGETDLKKAYNKSINTYFASLSLELGDRAMESVLKSFLVGENINLGFAQLKSTAEFTGSDYNLASIGYGQGAVALSPLHIAMIGQSIINHGRMVQPTVVKAMFDAYGNEVYRNTEHSLLAHTVKDDIAEKVKGLMNGLVKENYPEWEEKYKTNIYAKTGTAQPKDYSKLYNAYFLCMTDEYVILATVNNTPMHGSNLSYIAENLLNELY